MGCTASSSPTNHANQCCPVSGVAFKGNACCPLKHGTVWAKPYPGYVHGRHPEICKHGCIPSINPHGVETSRCRLLREAREFIELFYFEQGASLDSVKIRMEEIKKEVQMTGTYTHTKEELEGGARIAWRNAPKCANRKFWKSLELLDRRDVNTNEGMYEACVDHLSRAIKEGVTKTYIQVFKPRHPEKGTGPKIWSDQLVRFACFEDDAGELIGDPANLGFTEMVQSRFGWSPKKKGPFEVLPLVVQAEGQEPQAFDLPEPCCLLIDIWHPDYPFLSELNLKWTGIPAVSCITLELGGLSYEAAPFNGWFADTEVVRDLADADRYDMLPSIAEKMHLNIDRDSTLWKDQAMTVLAQAVMHSFSHGKIGIVDHHTMLAAFWAWYHDELKTRGWCPGNWKWIIPPMSSSTVQGYMGLNKMIEYTLKPMYIAGPGWRRYDANHYGKSDPVLSAKRLATLVYCSWAIGKMLRHGRKNRKHILIVYASSNDTTRRFASMATMVLQTNCKVELMSAETINEYIHETFDYHLARTSLFVLATATYGQGDPPAEAEGFYKYLQSENIPQLVGKDVAVLGFGNSGFKHFCGAAIKFEKLLQQKGAVPFVPVTLCDEMHGRQETFDEWMDEVVQKLKGDEERPSGRVSVRSTITTVTSLVMEKTLTLKNVNSTGQPLKYPLELDWVDTSLESSNVKSAASRLLRSDGQSHHKAVHDHYFEAVAVGVDAISGDQSKWAETSATGLALVRLAPNGKFPYHAGDHVAIMPFGHQFSATIEDICRALSVDPDKVFVVKPLAGKEFHKYMHPLLYTIQHRYVTMRRVLSTWAGIGELVTPLACSELMRWAEADSDREELETGALEENYATELVPGGLRFAQLFSFFPSLRVPVEVFLMLLPAVRPRLYSVASSPKSDPDEVHLIVGRVIFKGEKSVKGIASDDLSTLKSGVTLHFQPRVCLSFHLPCDPRSPVVFVGTGSGLAPFRGFWRDRMALADDGQILGPAVLIYGCRTEPQGGIKEELEKCLSTGALTQVMMCVSSKRPHFHVQDLVAEQRSTSAFSGLINHPKCEFFLCGGNGMVDAVKDSFSNGDGQWYAKVQSEHRWHEDVFAQEASTGTSSSSVIRHSGHSTNHIRKVASI